MSETPSEGLFDRLRVESGERLTEAFVLLSHAQSLESSPPLQDRTEAILLRGLAYVSIYASLEFTVRKAVNITLQSIGSVSPRSNHLVPRLHSIAQDGEFKSISASSPSKTWERRVQALDKIFSDAACEMPDTAFDMYLQNVKRPVLEQLFECLDLPGAVVPANECFGYLQEVVDGRNAVAHGRSSAMEQGRRHRCSELMLRHAAISEICRHVLEVFEAYVAGFLFISPEHRSGYLT